MANVSLDVELTPVITVNDSTAYTILNLLELYCRANNTTIEVSHHKYQDSNDYDIILNLVNDDFKEDNKNGN